MITWWRTIVEQRRADRAVLVVALLEHVGPLTHSRLRQYLGGSDVALQSVLTRLEGCGRIESEWIDGPRPRHRIYRAAS